ncbi:VWA domain-containing protein [Candidatus Poribacteria bacterium]|nr:VWA domain-containing protein [Candidatus Poribacteria bacterium]
MQFLNPAAFYLLGFVPIVVVLHFLKLRRYTHRVPSIMLWLSTDEDRRANIPFQRLRNLLLPLLQVLFLLLVTLSVARPALRRPGFMPGRAILIIDNSASMLATEVGQTRLALAKQAALDHIEQVSAEGGMMLMLTNAAAIQEAFTTDTAKLQRAIKNIPKSEAPRNLQPVFDAATHYAESPQDEVFFFSDNFDNLPDISLPVHKIGVGGAAENVGIVHFNVEVVAGKYEVLVGVRNFTDAPRELDVQLAVEGEPFDVKTVSIPPGKTKSILFSGDPIGLEGRVMSAHLQVKDNFVVDNSASALLSGVSPLRILLVSDNQKSLLPALLRTYGKHVQLHQVVPADYHGTGNAHIAIFDSGTPAGREAFGGATEVASGTHLIFVNPGSNLPFVPEDARVVEEVTAPVRVIKTDETHPLMVDVSLQGLQVIKSTHRALPLLGHSLVETEKGSLIWIGEKSGSHFVVFEFDAFNFDVSRPESHTLALTIPDGPLFFYHCLAWFEARSAVLQPVVFQDGQTRHAFRTGEHVRIASIAEDTTLQVQKPDKKMVPVHNSIFTDTDQVGVYTLYADNRPLERFTVNLLDANVSALSHSVTGQDTDGTALVTEGGLQPMTQEVWRWFALMAFLLLLLEWWFYHRSDL